MAREILAHFVVFGLCYCYGVSLYRVLYFDLYNMCFWHLRVGRETAGEGLAESCDAWTKGAGDKGLSVRELLSEQPERKTVDHPLLLVVQVENSRSLMSPWHGG